MPKPKRPTVITLLAGWLIVCSVVGIVVFSLVLPKVDTIQTEGPLAEWIVEHLGRAGLLVVTLIVYSVAGSTGVGLWKLRAWGRNLALLASLSLAAMSVVVGIITAVKDHAFNLNALVLLIVFGWPMYYFNRPGVKARGKLDLEEAFIDASFTGAKKGASRSGPPNAAKGRKSSLSPMITVFLSPLVSKALRRTKANSSKGSSGTASSTPSRRD